jgi:hypothetical protein
MEEVKEFRITPNTSQKSTLRLMLIFNDNRFVVEDILNVNGLNDAVYTIDKYFRNIKPFSVIS